MAYYLRLFTKSHAQPSGEEVYKAIEKETGSPPVLALAQGVEAGWRQIMVRTESGRDVCLIERNARGDEDGLFEEEVEEFKDLLAESLPTRGAQWVTQYLDEAAAVYSLRYLEAALAGQVQPSPIAVLRAIKGVVGGIVQADGEGFTNEAGYTIVWHFPEGTTGRWNFAALEDDGHWRNVGFDLEDEAKSLAFQQGLL